MLLLFETPAGYSLFKVKDEKKLQDAEVRATRLDRGTRDAKDARTRTRRRGTIDAAAVGRATPGGEGGARRRETRERGLEDGRGRETARRGTRMGRARSEGAIRSIREGIGELGIGGRTRERTRANGRADEGETDDVRARDRERRSCKMLSARWKGRRRWCR